MNTRDPDKIEDSLDNIDAKFSQGNVPEEDKEAFAKARNLIPNLRKKKRKYFLIYKARYQEFF